MEDLGLDDSHIPPGLRKPHRVSKHDPLFALLTAPPKPMQMRMPAPHYHRGGGVEPSHAYGRHPAPLPSQSMAALDARAGLRHTYDARGLPVTGYDHRGMPLSRSLSDEHGVGRGMIAAPPQPYHVASYRPELSDSMQGSSYPHRGPTASPPAFTDSSLDLDLRLDALNNMFGDAHGPLSLHIDPPSMSEFDFAQLGSSALSSKEK